MSEIPDRLMELDGENGLLRTDVKRLTARIEAFAAALAERDKRIADLEALVQKMKCCQNCDVYNKNVNDIPFPCQVCVKHNKWRMK